VLKPNLTTKRLEEIEGIQGRLRTLAKEYKNDFTEPNALDAVIDKDLLAAVGSLELHSLRQGSPIQRPCRQAAPN
jgi:hypothetical protein